MKLSRGFRVGRTGAPTILKGFATQGTFSWGYYKPTKKTRCILKIHKWIVVCPASLRSGNFPCARAATLTAREHRDGSLGWDPGWRCQRLVQHIALEILRTLIQKPACLPWAEKSLEVSAAGMHLALWFSAPSDLQLLRLEDDALLWLCIPFSSSLRGWREITLNTEAGSWRQLLVIDSTKYETACTSSMKHGISSILLVGEMNGARDNLGKLGIC